MTSSSRTSCSIVPESSTFRWCLFWGSLRKNGYCESFNGKLRKECLNGEIFYSLKEARIVIEQWQQRYNRVRPSAAFQGLK